ncbi:DUF1684 domain-containing protein [Chryseobacterium sp. A301]
MKPILFLLFALFISCSTRHTASSTEIEKDILTFQSGLNKEYLDSATTPLRGANFDKFTSHPFFPVDLKYRVLAKLSKVKNAKPFEIQTSSGKIKVYRPYAVAQFEIEGQALELTLYQSMDLMKRQEYKDYLFLPFRDGTNGDTTYGGGKYIDLRIPKDGKNQIVIDFNKSYHPYCAYNAYDYSCPIVPAENKLPISIKAGVMYEPVYF